MLQILENNSIHSVVSKIEYEIVHKKNLIGTKEVTSTMLYTQLLFMQDFKLLTKFISFQSMPSGKNRNHAK